MRTLVRRIAGLFLFAAVATAAAQDYPTRPVRVLVPYGPGTGVDLVARAVTDRLSKNLGQPFVIENRPGAAGTIAGAIVASAPHDGYTLLIDTASMTTVPSLMKKIPYDPRRDFAPVAILSTTPLVLVTASSNGYRNVKDLIVAGKAKPGSISFASAGIGTTTHLAAERFRIGAGFQALHVPYKTTTEALADVLSGRVTYLITSPATLIGSIKDGRLVALGTSISRTPMLPNVPTLAEAGVPNAETNAWFALFAPAKTPPELVARLNAEVQKAIAAPEMKQRFVELGVDSQPMGVKEFEALLGREFAEGDRLIKSLGIRIE
jgi:tripartite-type tricarboxylate transporter receptor subunit TctC